MPKLIVVWGTARVLLLAGSVAAATAWAAMSRSAASADRRLLPPDGCLCPVGEATAAGELTGYAGTPPRPPITFDRDRSTETETVVFAPFGSDTCVPGDGVTSRVDYDVWQMQFCDVDKDHALRVRVTGSEALRPYVALFWSGGGPDPFTGIACTHQIAAAGGEGLPAVAEVGIGRGDGPTLDGHVDIVVTPVSREVGGSYDLHVEAGGCRRPEVRVADPEIDSIDDVCRGEPLSMRWSLTNEGDVDLPDNPDGEALGGREMVVTLQPPWRFVSGNLDGGSCAVEDGALACDFSLAAGASAVATAKAVAEEGVAGLEPVVWQAVVEVDEDQDGFNERARATVPGRPIVIDCGAPVEPRRMAALQTFVPLLPDEACAHDLDVVALGDRAVRTAIVSFGPGGACRPRDRGPIHVSCTGPIRPGGTWRVGSEALSNDAAGVMVFRFSTRALSEFGLDAVLGFDDTFADLMCDALAATVVGDAEAFLRFRRAYDQGGTFGGIPLVLASGARDGGQVEVSVSRACGSAPGTGGDGGVAGTGRSRYEGVPASRLAVPEAESRVAEALAPLVQTDGLRMDTRLAVQNAGTACAEVEVWLDGRGSCLDRRPCYVGAVAAGETVVVRASDCVAPFSGAARVRSTQPVAVAVEVAGSVTRMAYTGAPRSIAFPTAGETAASGETAAMVAPLALGRTGGWSSGVWVQNEAARDAAHVRLTFHDADGTARAVLDDWLCPNAVGAYALPSVSALPSDWMGTVVVESVAWSPDGEGVAVQPRLAAVAAVAQEVDARGSRSGGGAAYRLWAPGEVAGRSESVMPTEPVTSGVGGTVVVVPVGAEGGASAPDSASSELVIANTDSLPGTTGAAVYLFDKDGLVAQRCLSLTERQLAVVDLAELGVGAGFSGMAAVSASYWDRGGGGLESERSGAGAGLTAAIWYRPLGMPDEGPPGDRAWAAPGFFLEPSLLRSVAASLGFDGDALPACPRPGTVLHRGTGFDRARVEPGASLDGLRPRLAAR